MCIRHKPLFIGLHLLSSRAETFDHFHGVDLKLVETHTQSDNHTHTSKKAIVLVA